MNLMEYSKPEVEMWKDIEGYENIYQVSTFGRVRSIDKFGENGRLYKGVLKKHGDNGRGYMFANLSHNGKKKNFYVHRLVASAFLPNNLNKKEVNHKDGNKKNNFVSNLEWCTRAENVSHCFSSGLNENAGSPQKIYVFDGDNLVIYRSFKELCLSIGKSDSWCGKRLEKNNNFNYKGLTVSRDEIDTGAKIIFNVDNINEVSDGSHSISELYYHRMILFSVICNNNKRIAWKSWKHHDGTMYDDYFIVGVTTKEGDYTYHYHKDDWDRFNVKELPLAPEWDGHEPKDITRLLTINWYE